MGLIDEARRMRSFIEQMATSLDDETAEQHADVFPSWEVGRYYEADYRIRYNGVLYKVLQEHTSQADWTPDVAVSLYVKCHKQDPHEEYPEWVQPTGGHDAYNKGDKVTFEGKHYESLIDANVWSPKDYPQGWQEIE